MRLELSGKPLLIDLFCGAGGASMGYSQAGFDVIGVDLNPMPRYPFSFIEADALEFLDWLYAHPTNVFFGRQVAAVHASPPCQAYSTSTGFARNKGLTYPDLIVPTRERLDCPGLPYVIENVPRAPLIDPVTLCGSQFGLTAELPGYGLVALRRHRLFETNWGPLPDPESPHDHSLPCVSVIGGASPSPERKKFGGSVPPGVRRELMQIDWMANRELSESIPPAYSKYVGKYLLAALTATQRHQHELAA